MSVESCFVLILMIPVAVSIGELALGKLLSVTMTSVLATRPQIPLAFARLVVLKLGIWISLIVLFACAVFLVTMSDVSDRYRMRYFYGISPLFIFPLVAFFSLQFSAWVRLELRRSRGSERLTAKEQRRSKSDTESAR